MRRTIARFSSTILLFALAVGLWSTAASGVSNVVVIADFDLEGSGAAWSMDNDYDYSTGGPCYAETGFQVEDASLLQGTLHNDAFDGGLLLLVNGVTFNDPDGNGTLSMGDRQMAVGPVVMSKLRVTRTERALTTSPTLRSLVGFRNPTKKAITATVLWDSATGADDDGGVRGSSNADLKFTKADSWVASSDDPGTVGDATVTFVVYGPGKPAVRTTKVLNAPGGAPKGPKPGASGCVTVRFKITVPAKSTRYLLFFTELRGSNQDAVNNAVRFTAIKPTAKVFDGLSKQVRKNVLNFDLT